MLRDAGAGDGAHRDRADADDACHDQRLPCRTPLGGLAVERPFTDDEIGQERERRRLHQQAQRHEAERQPQRDGSKYSFGRHPANATDAPR
jgi:hypothetical protein